MFAIGTEARLIIPHEDKQGSSVNIEYFQKMAIEIAGGATKYNGFGSWTDHNGDLVQESVAILDIACDHGSDVERSLLDLACEICADLDQDCVYFRDAAGTVHLVEQGDNGWK